MYWIGPIIGGLLAAGFYKFIKVLEYETVNPGQDDSGETVSSSKYDQNQNNLGPFSPMPLPGVNLGGPHHHAAGGDTRTGESYKNGPTVEAGRGETSSP